MSGPTDQLYSDSQMIVSTAGITVSTTVEERAFRNGL